MALQLNFLGIETRTQLRLQFVEQQIRKHRLIVPAPSRPKLIKLIEEGKLEGKRTDFGYVVFEDSFEQWVRNEFGRQYQEAA